MEGTCHFVKVFFPPAFEFIILSSTTSLFSELCVLILERMVSMQPNMYSKVFTSLWWYLQGIFSQRQEDKSNPQECAQICARSWTSSWWSKSDEDNGRCESLSIKKHTERRIPSKVGVSLQTFDQSYYFLIIKWLGIKVSICYPHPHKEKNSHDYNFALSYTFGSQNIDMASGLNTYGSSRIFGKWLWGD